MKEIVFEPCQITAMIQKESWHQLKTEAWMVPHMIAYTRIHSFSDVGNCFGNLRGSTEKRQSGKY